MPLTNLLNLTSYLCFLLLQYADKIFVRKFRDSRSVAQQMWEAVRINDKKSVYRLIVCSDADVNSVYDQATYNSSLTLAKVMLLQEQSGSDHNSGFLEADTMTKSSSTSNVANNSEGHAIEDIDVCSLLHVACESADIGMLELLLQYGANINALDARGQVPLHRCILRGKAAFAKLLLTR